MKNKKIITIVCICVFLVILSVTIKSYILPEIDMKNNNTIITGNGNIVSAQPVENWQKIQTGLYFDVNSVKIQDDYISGNFKNYIIDIDDKVQNSKEVAYSTIWTAASCNIELQGGVRKMEYPIYKFYDINNNLIGENDIHKDWQKDHPDGHLGITYPEDVENGNIMFDTLCKFYSN